MPPTLWSHPVSALPNTSITVLASTLNPPPPFPRALRVPPILRVLQTEGRIAAVELARRIGLSKSPTQARLKRLEETGVITGYRR